jgi:hypothetical protein
MFRVLSPKPQLRLDSHFVIESNYAIYNIKMSIPLSFSDQGPLENGCESQGRGRNVAGYYCMCRTRLQLRT